MEIRITHYALRITHYASRITHCVPRFPLYIGGALGLSSAAAWLALRNPLSRVAVGLWLVALAGTLWAAWQHDRPNVAEWMRAIRAQRWIMIEVVAVAALMLVAFGLRAYDLAHYPPAFHGDEGEMGLMALRILNGSPLPPFATGWLDHPTLFHYLQVLSIKIWGTNEVGLRMLGVWWGAACVPLIYVLGRTGWGKVAGFTAAWLLAVSHLHIHFSRIGLNNIHSVAAMIALMLLFTLAYKWEHGPRMLLFVGAGLVLGLSQYLYYGSRLLPILAAPVVWWLWRDRRISSGEIMALGCAFVVAYAPLGWFYANHWHAFTNRTSGVNIFNPRNVQHTLGPSATLPAALWPLLRVQFERNVGFFINGGDHSSFYSADVAGFDQVTIILFWIGLATALVHLRRFGDRMLVLWWGMGLVLAGVLTNDAPNAPRLIVIVPAALLLAGAGGQRLWQFVAARGVRWHSCVPIFAAAAAFSLIANAHTYFVEYGRTAGGLVPITVAREMIAEPRANAVFFLGSPYIYAGHGTIQFIAGAANPRDLEHPDQVKDAYQAGQSVLLVAVPQRTAELDTIAQQFPGGTRTDYVDPLGRSIGATYRIPARR